MFNGNRKNQGPSVNASDTSLVSRGMTIRGDVKFSGALHLDGVVEGSIQADAKGDSVLTISETGRVTGQINVPHAVVNGRVVGDIDVFDRLELAAQARIEGDVRYQVLEMAAGAQVNGKMAHRAPEAPRQLEAPETEIMPSLAAQA
ncbi:cytoskeletal protein CcmA (bactofilin family) [Luteibacter rhizovicinus]|uniref:Cytoskeletal protein CcmA (Bactofilin family) n=1 Tax=Luteibacter rhizovicinus TaxID=242606 RepID=A0A4R3YTM1_9GAMM|nr:polymer-forming cytoskeletal protein [Luteibacter rhizovicinus]TCV96297.1 cytoskeletal protein CcmA (bactofilin family) [Luteibacter rhizovicinus]